MVGVVSSRQVLGTETEHFTLDSLFLVLRTKYDVPVRRTSCFAYRRCASDAPRIVSAFCAPLIVATSYIAIRVPHFYRRGQQLAETLSPCQLRIAPRDEIQAALG